MTAPRSGHTATLLPDGKVFIAGGRTNATTGTDADYFATLASAEIYDPGTGAFSATGEMSTARWGSNATLLNNGRVLFAGGLTGGVNSYSRAAAELYDPATGTSAGTGNIFSGWTTDTATLLVNGKALLTRDFLSAELYDPSTNTFSGTGQHENRAGSTATLLTNGKVLVAGGNGAYEDSPSPLAELYDPDSGTFARTGWFESGTVASKLVWIYNRLGISFMQVSKWGNSLAVRLPAVVVEALDLKEGDEIEISIAGKRDFKVSRDRSKERALEQLRQMKWSFPPDFKFNREEINER
jgi:antitoxin component of MazEF toxin-antitoxin module